MFCRKETIDQWEGGCCRGRGRGGAAATGGAGVDSTCASYNGRRLLQGRRRRHICCNESGKEGEAKISGSRVLERGRAREREREGRCWCLVCTEKRSFPSVEKGGERVQRRACVEWIYGIWGCEVGRADKAGCDAKPKSIAAKTRCCHWDEWEV